MNAGWKNSVQQDLCLNLNTAEIIIFCFWVSLRIFGVEKADVFAAPVYYHPNLYIPVTFLNPISLTPEQSYAIVFIGSNHSKGETRI